MLFELTRIYHPNWTEGMVSLNNVILAHSMELPWKGNTRNISCIPEGIYPLSFRQSQKFNSHVLIHDVPDRDLILIHPANDVHRQLKGCIAPVLRLDGNGKGSYSRLALNLVMKNMSRNTNQNNFLKVGEVIH